MRHMIESYHGLLVPKLHLAASPAAADFNEIREWCDQHCRERYYMLPPWKDVKGAEFEDDEDAESFRVWAALRWA